MIKNFFDIREYGVNNKKVIYLIGGWGTSQLMMSPVSNILAIAGFYCITCTLRKTVLTPDMKKTTESILEVKQYIMYSMQRLTQQGHTYFSIFGTSLGALVGLLVADSSKQVNKVIFNIPGADLAESMWRWDGVLTQFRTDLVSRYHSRKELSRIVAPINCTNHFDNLHDKDMLFYLSANDKIALNNPRKLSNTLKSHNYRFRIIVNQTFGHLATGIMNLANAPQYLSFLSAPTRWY